MERLRGLSSVLNIINSQDSNPNLFENKVFKFTEVLQLAKDLCSAMQYLHNDVHPEACIIHRDLKPENLGLTSDGELKLFGK